MNHIGAVLIVALLLSSCARTMEQEGQPMSPSTQEIIALERAALDRWIAFDPDGYFDLSLPEITYFDPYQEKRIDGIEALKAVLEPIRSGTGAITGARYEMIDPKVREHGDMALLTFNLINYGRVNDAPEVVLARWNSTEVYIRAGKTWKLIHSHWSHTKPERKP